jgi:hypothetical protein
MVLPLKGSSFPVCVDLGTDAAEGRLLDSRNVRNKLAKMLTTSRKSATRLTGLFSVDFGCSLKLPG